MKPILYVQSFLILSAISLFLMAIFEKYEVGDETWDGWFLFYFRRHPLSMFRIFHQFIYNIIAFFLPISAHPEDHNGITRVVCGLLGCLCLFIAFKIG